MIVAAPYENGMIFQHFGKTAQFKLYTVEQETIAESRVVGTNGKGHGELVGVLKGYGVNVLICGGLGAGAKTALANEGIKVYGGVTGACDAAAAAFLAGTLQYNPDAACKHHGAGEHTCHS